MFRPYYKFFFMKTDIKCLPKRFFNSSTFIKEKWDLISAVCLERRPVIVQPLNKLEIDYKKMLSEIEFERSFKSDHEIRHEKELKQIEQLKSGSDVDVHLKETAQDFEDAGIEELSRFKFASKVTEADEKNDFKSLKRKLEKHLVLVVKQKIGKDNFYLLPQALRQDGETLRQTADRVLKDTCGSELKAMIYGNAPSSFYKYKYPKTSRNESQSVGAKVFIYFARYQQGQLQKSGLDYQWLDREELTKILPSEYQKSVLQMLIDE